MITFGYPLRVMDDFKTYYQRLSATERKAFAKKVGTTPGYCNLLACGAKKIELGFADAIAAVSGLPLASLPLTDRAKQQHKVRTMNHKTAQAKAKARGG